MDLITQMLRSSKQNATPVVIQKWTPSAGYAGGSFSPSRPFTYSALNWTLTAGDTLDATGSYATAAQYVSYLSSKHPTMTPSLVADKIRMGNPVVLNYFSHVIAGDGKSGSVTFNKSGTYLVDGGESGNSYYVSWTLSMVINFTLV